MKQLLSLFLFLLPYFALAQYPSNGNQKITIGEQTTADGLVWRGIANDTNIITPLSDTSAYIILDTISSKFYHYNRTTTFWTLAGGGVTSISALNITQNGIGITSSVTDSTNKPIITLNIPNAGMTTRGVVSTTGQTFNGSKTFSSGIYTQGLGLFGPQFSSDGYDRMLGSADGAVGFVRITNGLSLSGDSLKNGMALTTNGSRGVATFDGTTLNIPNYLPSGGQPLGSVTEINQGIGIDLLPNPITQTGFISVDTNFVITRFDTTAMLLPYFKKTDTTQLNLTSRFAGKQNTITLTTTGTSGAATLVGSTLNIPQYSSGSVSIGSTITGATAGSILFAGTSGVLSQNNSNLFYNNTNNRLGIGLSNPTAKLHLSAGSETASTAPIKLTSGVDLTTPEAGAIEFNGTNLLFTPSSVRYTVCHGITATSVLDFPQMLPSQFAVATVSVPGARDGDVVMLGTPNSSNDVTNIGYFAWVSANDVVSIRCINNSTQANRDPGVGTFKIFIVK